MAKVPLMTASVLTENLHRLSNLLATRGIGAGHSPEMNKTISDMMLRIKDQFEEEDRRWSSLYSIYKALPQHVRIVHVQDSYKEHMRRYLEVPGHSIQIDCNYPHMTFDYEHAREFQEQRKRYSDGRGIDNRAVVLFATGIAKTTALEWWLKGHSIHRVGIQHVPGIQINVGGSLFQHVVEQPLLNQTLAGLFDHGECLPDYSCCNPEGLWSYQKRREYVAASDTERMAMQQRQLSAMFGQRMVLQTEEDIHAAECSQGSCDC